MNGSFYRERKTDLLRLRDAVRQYGYLNACISEDLDDRPQEAQDPFDPIYDRRLSVQLIDRSVAHVFVLAMPEEDEPANLIQSRRHCDSCYFLDITRAVMDGVGERPACPPGPEAACASRERGCPTLRLST